MKSELKVCVVVPAFNEEAAISTTLRELKKIDGLSIVVVDDASEDTTRIVALDEKVEVISLKKNHGVGGAMQEGFRFALGEKFDCVIQVDGDGQHDPVSIVDLISEFCTSGSDVVIGKRFHEKCEYKTPLARSVGIRLLRMLINLFSGSRKKIMDPTSGYRLFGVEALKKFEKKYPQRCPEAVATFWLLKDGCSVSEVPVSMRQRLTGRSSFHSFVGFGWFAVCAVEIVIEGVFRRRVVIDQ
ncbi:glycosyltransferase family 2 protein [Pseudomonadota bacterium]